MILADYATIGQNSMQAFQTVAVIAQVGAVFGVYFKSKSRELKNTAVSAGVTGLFGITEPIIYGVTLRLKKPFICACVAGAVGGGIISLFKGVYYAFAGLPGPLTMVNAIGANPNSFMGVAIGCGVALVLAFVLVQIVGFDDPQEKTDDLQEKAAVPETLTAAEKLPEVQTGVLELVSPLAGELMPLENVNDPTFSTGILGRGAAIMPSEGKLYAPCDGVISMVPESGHAVGISTASGLDVLMHIGLETVTLKGQHFRVKTSVGATVKKGELLIDFDLNDIKELGFDMVTPVLVLNAEEKNMNLLKEHGTVKSGEIILDVEI